MDFSNHFNRVGYVVALGNDALRGRGRVTREEEASALLQGTLGGSCEMLYVEIEAGPDSSRCEWASVMVPEEYQCALDAFEHSALDREPTLAE